MSDFINYLQHRIEETKLDLQGAKDRVQQAVADEQMLGTELQGYERTLAAEMRRQGISVINSGVQDSLALSENVNVEASVNKAEFARQFIRNHAETGAKPADLFKGFVDAGIPIKKAYIYSLVQRLQEQEVIRSRRGKWYPVPESEQSVNGTAEKSLP